MTIQITPPLTINTRTLSVKDADNRTIFTPPSWMYVSSADDVAFESRRDQYIFDLNALVDAWNELNPPETP